MGKIKEWFESNIDTFTDEELLTQGYSHEEINFLREEFGNEDVTTNNQ